MITSKEVSKLYIISFLESSLKLIVESFIGSKRCQLILKKTKFTFNILMLIWNSEYKHMDDDSNLFCKIFKKVLKNLLKNHILLYSN